jgi:hypothetical protein
MPLSRDQRNIAMVREHLRSLPDETGNSKSGGSVETFSREFDLSLDSVRVFRDGTDDALPMATRTLLARVVGAAGGASGYTYDDQLDEFGTFQISFNGIGPDDDRRLARYQQYNLIDKTRGEAHSALDAWMDLGVTGGVGGDNSRTPFVPEYQGTDEAGRAVLKEIGDNVNRNLMPGETKLQAFRTMCKYGDGFGEVVLEEVNGALDVAAVNPLHPRTMFANRMENGQIDPADAWVQRLPPRLIEQARFPAWKVARFANIVEWGSTHGESIFEPNLRSYIQLEAMEVAMIIRRLTRAPLRYHHILDVGHVMADKIEDTIDTRRRKWAKRPTVDVNGKVGRFGINLPTEEDLWTAKKDKESPADVGVLAGDASIGEIADFIHFFQKWLAGLGPPKAHLGYESETMRSTITDLHIVFARKCRRMQMRFIKGLNHLYWVSLVLRGIDPRTVPYLIVPPTMGTRDELVRAQVMQAYAVTVKYLAEACGITGKAPSPAWFLKWVVGLSEEAIDALELKDVMKLTKKGMKNDPASGAVPTELDQAALRAIGESDAVASEVAATTFLLGERAIAKGQEKVLGLSRHPFEQREFAPVSAQEFGAFSRTLGKHPWQLRRLA